MRKRHKNKQKQNCIGFIPPVIEALHDLSDNDGIKNSVVPTSVDEVTQNKEIESDEVRIDSILSDGKSYELGASFKVVMPRLVYYKMLTYCKLVDDEISGLGYIEKVDSNTFKVSDVYLLKQTVSAATCKLDVDAQCALMQQIISEGKNPSNLKFWWHSHANMAAMWSAQDEATGKLVACDYYVSLVINHSGEMRCRLNVYQPIEFKVDNIKVIMVDDVDLTEMIKECALEIKEKVFTERSIVYSGGNTTAEEFGFGYNYLGYDSNRHNWKDDVITQPIPSKAEQRKDDLFLPPFNSPIKDTREAIDEATMKFYGNHFIVGNYSFVWDESTKLYDVYDANNRKLTLDEVIACGLQEYADPNYYLTGKISNA